MKESVVGIYARDYRAEKPIIPEATTGVFLSARAADPVDEIIRGIRFFERIEDQILPSACVAQAQKFSPAVFHAEWQKLISGVHLPTVNA